jgi:hypothetical protein
MAIFTFLVGILLPVGLGVLVWKKFDFYFPKNTATSELSQYIKKLMSVFGVALISMYGIFLFI